MKTSILSSPERVAVVGLGYVGLPLAVAFSKKVETCIGFDLNDEKINLYKQGKDPTEELGDYEVKSSSVIFTSDESLLKDSTFFIVAVPTPVNDDHTPDLEPVKSASKIIGRNLSKGSVVVFESTVYPGVTEEICVPIIENESGLRCGSDFKVGYSPERINPGDKVHRLENIVKIVSGMDADSLERISSVYSLVVKAGVYKASSIKVAEAAKVIENAQRDINIAFMNELSMIFHKMNINTTEVLEAASTKWNFLPFTPGLVGGHCIGIDPYYLIYRANQVRYHSLIMSSARRINDDMGKFCADSIIQLLIKNDVLVKRAKVCIFGFTFKEDCPDTRNTKVMDIIKELQKYEVEPLIYDPIGDRKEAKRLYDVDFVSENEIKELDAAVFAVKHSIFKNYSLESLEDIFNSSHNKKILVDLKSCFNRKDFDSKNWLYWCL